MKSTTDLQFTLVTPAGIRYNDIATQVTVPTEDGEITILPEHNVLISTLQAGEIVIKNHDGQTVLAISNGILEMRLNNVLYILADTAEHAADIDIDRAEKAKKRAQELLASVEESDSNIEYARIQAKIKKEMARISVGNKYRDIK